ncbi:MAG: hypothetical protein A2Y40_10950 [Candidatus Margulisbacteria bacterium GWF2_35_9]|nr:MAG: hypothetical protein A2Y40_10950 [Candidatus Margulisbacteria bacterium GWF2_35_9]
MELDNIIKERRTVRKFTKHIVSDEEINTIIDAALWAPSWANTQTWEFIIVRDKDQITRITEAYSNTNSARECSLNASALIMACAKTRISGCKNGLQRTKLSSWYMFDLGLAVQNLLLKAHEIGLGTVVVGAMDHEKVKKMLKLPVNYEVVVAIPIGKAAPGGTREAKRKDLKGATHLDFFKNPY